MTATATESGQSASGGWRRTARHHRVASNRDTEPDCWEGLCVTPGSTMSNMRTRGRNVRRTADTALLRDIAPGARTAA